MGKLSDEAINGWIHAGEHFEMRGDGAGLYLHHRKGDASPTWQFRFREEGKQHKLRIGRYPDMSIDDARALALSYRRMIECGESVISAISNQRLAASDKELARTFSAMLREASRHGARRMTVTIEFETGESALWAK